MSGMLRSHEKAAAKMTPQFAEESFSITLHGAVAIDDRDGRGTFVKSTIERRVSMIP